MTGPEGTEADRIRMRKLPKERYEAELAHLQAELVTMQAWVQQTGNRLVVICEGRDAAGKGSAIKRMTEYLNPRWVRIAALPSPSDRQKTQWYFQRYVEHLPAAGEIVVFDRSWYNRAGVERVMGFCTDVEYERFLRQVPVFEQMLIDDGIMLRKYWFSVSDVEQERRFRSRRDDPMRRWKLSPMDVESITRWEDYSRAKDRMFAHTDLPSSPWFVVESEDKKRSRINVIRHLLDSVPYLHLQPPTVEIPTRPEARDYLRPPRNSQRYVPDYADTLLDHNDTDKSKTKGKGKGKGKEAKDGDAKPAKPDKGEGNTKGDTGKAGKDGGPQAGPDVDPTALAAQSGGTPEPDPATSGTPATGRRSASHGTTTKRAARKTAVPRATPASGGNSGRS